MTAEIHSAARAFEGAEAAYEHGRPGYPPDAIDALAANLRIGPGSDVLDVAAGTGKLTRLLVATRARVVAVEPVAGMRAALRRNVPGTEVLAGTAEALPLADASVDAVTVAQAFHWFDPERALAEIHRVLRPGGGLGLVWNAWDTSSGWVARLDELLSRHYPPDVPRHRSREWRRPFEASNLFTPLEERAFRNVQKADRATVRSRVASVSVVAALPPDEREDVLRRVDEIVAPLPPSFELVYRTLVCWSRRR